MQPQYRNYPHQQPPQRSPHVAAPQRRGGIGPMVAAGPPAPNSNNNAAQLAHASQAKQLSDSLARLRSRKPTDKALPDGIEAFTVDDACVDRYRALRDLERRLDATMTRKRLDIGEATVRAPKRFRTLRVWISNTVEDQVWQAEGLTADSFDFTPNTEPTYRLRIEGRVLPEEEGEDSSPPPPRFSQLFKAITVEPDHARAEPIAEWKKPDKMAAANDFDELVIKRPGDENTPLTIHLHRHEEPERFRFSPALADVVDAAHGTRADAALGLWAYISLHRLQEDEEKRNFRCDARLRQVTLGRDTGHIPLLNDYITQHISPLEPVALAYTLRVDEAFQRGDAVPTVYDVQVAVDEGAAAHTLGAGLQLGSSGYAGLLREVTALDDKLARTVAAVGAARAKHAFLTGLSGDPAGFVRTWLGSQKRDLDVIMGDAARVGGNGGGVNGDEWRRAEAWATENARESVKVLLAQQRR